MVNAENGCYTVNVQVYIVSADTGQSYLVVKDNVQVGDCSNDNRFLNTECQRVLPNGDFVFENSR